MTIKAGARHNKGDMTTGRAAKQKARDIVGHLEELGFVDEDQPAPEENALKAVSETDTELRVANYIVLFGGRDLEGEYFTPQTKLESEYTAKGKLDVDWEHGRNAKADGLGKNDILGWVDWATAKADERGVWVERVLNRSNKYVQWIQQLIKAGRVGSSSEALTARVQKSQDGQILTWPLYRDSLTVTPMEPRMIGENLIAAYKALGIDPTDETEQPQATGPTGAAAQGGNVNTSTKSTGEINMTPEELAALLDKRDQEKAAKAKAEADIEQAKQDAVKAAVADERKRLEAEYAKSNRLPMGDNRAPHQARFGDTRKYDHLNASEAALVASLLLSARTVMHIPTGLAKSIMIKVAEDKSRAEVREVRHDAAKSIGLDPADALDAAKANELDYTTQTGYGDEFVPTVWSSSVWEAIRFGETLVAKIPQQMFTGPGDSFIVPVEGADPTWYRVGQTTDVNSTTGIPDSTIGTSKVATSNATMDLGAGKKMGARVPYSGEMTEDSIVPWASQVNKQLVTSFVEMVQHVAIDGDTATGATTNINHIGGTPTSTGATQDLFLLLNGFRKSPLVTTTANSLSAAGTLTDALFLSILQLLGPAGLYADPEKVDFLLDANVYWKALQLASVKTHDVFQNATLESGVLSKIWGYKVWRAPFMHYRSTTNPRKANTAGKVDLTTQSNNTTGSALAVRWDQWLLGYKRNLTLTTQGIPNTDSYQTIATARLNMIQRDTEGSSILYNIGV